MILTCACLDHEKAAKIIKNTSNLQCENIEQFYEENHDVLLDTTKGSLRPAQSVTKEAKRAIEKFKEFHVFLVPWPPLQFRVLPLLCQLSSGKAFGNLPRYLYRVSIPGEPGDHRILFSHESLRGNASLETLVNSFLLAHQQQKLLDNV